ncbi:tRNA glutamyl-Q(34) synthetase GluQRS [Coralliovum pocilloporae]|uniref:tRNA glutamyl-Q(34) synthetase GluQRS n=1 Tax=Coralliovum pocilloporae TaxID=3066369 RepID=UPI00330715BB
MTRQPVFRFAPSPNGLLHLGHALSALINFHAAKLLGGRFLLRIEDIDVTRSRPEFEEAIYEDLHWLGLDWETPVRRQSEHRTTYAAALETLKQTVRLYPAFLSRKEIRAAIEGQNTEQPWPNDPDGAPHYPPMDRLRSQDDIKTRLSAGEAFALRLDMQAALASCPSSLNWRELSDTGQEQFITASPADWGDVLLARKDFPASYHLSVVVDDAEQGVTHVVRGHDLYHATSVHRLLQTVLGYEPPVYHHHRLVLDGDGRKLSKSLASTSLDSLRRDGKTPDDIRKMVGFSEPDLRAFQQY